jgi:hypothetical protein
VSPPPTTTRGWLRRRERVSHQPGSRARSCLWPDAAHSTWRLARRNGVATIVAGLAAPVRGHPTFDLVTAVPPYVPTDGDPDWSRRTRNAANLAAPMGVPMALTSSPGHRYSRASSMPRRLAAHRDRRGSRPVARPNACQIVGGHWTPAARRPYRRKRQPAFWLMRGISPRWLSGLPRLPSHGRGVRATAKPRFLPAPVRGRPVFRFAVPRWRRRR